MVISSQMVTLHNNEHVIAQQTVKELYGEVDTDDEGGVE